MLLTPPTDPSTVWSTWVQPAEILDLTRELRFRDEVRGLLWPVLGLRRGGVAVDVGCGTGALTRALTRWMGPRCTAYGIDRDTNFLAYAANRAKQTGLARRLRFLQGDALALPLPANSADAVTSYTVIEHIPDHVAFVREQMRVCRRGGRVSIMSVQRGGLQSRPSPEWETSDREKELWKPLEEAGKRQVDRPWGVGKHSTSPLRLPKLLEQVGLADIMVDAFCNLCPLDDARVSTEQAERLLAAEERMLLDNAERLATLLKRPLPPGHLSALRRCIRARFANRRRRLDRGPRLWDFGIGINLIVSGRKP